MTYQWHVRNTFLHFPDDDASLNVLPRQRSASFSGFSKKDQLEENDAQRKNILEAPTSTTLSLFFSEFPPHQRSDLVDNDHAWCNKFYLSPLKDDLTASHFEAETETPPVSVDGNADAMTEDNNSNPNCGNLNSEANHSEEISSEVNSSEEPATSHADSLRCREEPSQEAVELYQHLWKMSGSRTITVEQMETLEAKIPFRNFIPEDDAGFPTSIGSVMHYQGTEGSACRPCFFWLRGTCVKGELCLHCHIRHVGLKPKRLRASKTTRQRQQAKRKLAEEAEEAEEVEQSATHETYV